MVRKIDKKKIVRILSCLIKHREGLWLRSLARESKLSVSTTSFYIEKILKDVVESLGVKDEKGRFLGIRIIRIKPEIYRIIENEEDKIKKILEFIEMIKKI